MYKDVHLFFKTFKKKLIIIPGTLAKISAGLIRFLPRRWIVSLYGKAGNKSKKN